MSSRRSSSKARFDNSEPIETLAIKEAEEKPAKNEESSMTEDGEIE